MLINIQAKDCPGSNQTSLDDLSKSTRNPGTNPESPPYFYLPFGELGSSIADKKGRKGVNGL
jgi:hypothetical protein